MIIEVQRHPGTPRDIDTVEVRTDDDDATGRPSRIEVIPNGAANVVITEVFNGLTLRTPDGEVLVVQMRDSGLEAVYQHDPNGAIFNVTMNNGEVIIS
jgi:hypothetical protein